MVNKREHMLPCMNYLYSVSFQKFVSHVFSTPLHDWCHNMRVPWHGYRTQLSVQINTASLTPALGRLVHLTNSCSSGYLTSWEWCTCTSTRMAVWQGPKSDHSMCIRRFKQHLFTVCITMWLSNYSSAQHNNQTNRSARHLVKLAFLCCKAFPQATFYCIALSRTRTYTSTHTHTYTNFKVYNRRDHNWGIC